MAFKSYLNYDEYLELGGTVSEDAFPILERKAQRYLDYITFDRCKELETIPDEVKEVLVEFIGRFDAYDKQSLGGEVITEYSNGIEKLKYSRTGEKAFTEQLYQISYKWLPDYLVNRSVKFDVSRYLQSENNNTEQTE